MRHWKSHAESSCREQTMRHSEPRRLAHLAALCAVSLATVAPVLAQSSLPAAPRLPGIVNFGQISSAYYRGGEPGSDGVLALAKLGIKTVIDLQMDANALES